MAPVVGTTGKNTLVKRCLKLWLVSVLTVGAGFGGQPLAVASPADLDPAFGDSGKKVISDTYFNGTPVLPLRVREDGRIVVLYVNEPMSGQGATVYQFNPDGSPDLTFGNGTGKIVPAQKVCTAWISCRVYAFDLQPDGKILLALAAPGLTAQVYAVGRLLATGEPDPSFGVNGSSYTPAGYQDVPVGIATLDDGSIVLGGASYLLSQTVYLSAAKFRSNGAPDTDFGVNGRLTFLAPIQVPPSTFRVQKDGKLLWAGRQGTFAGTVLVRAMANGQLDAGFADGGVYLDVAPMPFTYSDIVIQPDGRFVLAGSLPGNGTTTLAAMRLTSSGAVDTTFGKVGVAEVIPLPGLPSSGAAITVDAHGRFMLVGAAGELEYLTFQPTFPLVQVAVARLTPEGQPDLTFAPYGVSTFWNGRSSVGLSVVMVGEQIIVGGTTELAPTKVTFDFLARTPLPTLFRLKGGTNAMPYGLRQAEAVEFHHSAWNHYFVSAMSSEIADLDAKSIDWQRTGKTFKVWSEQGADVLPVCRFFSDQSFAPKSSHFYTPYAAECSSLQTGSVWKYEGQVFGMTLPEGTASGAVCAVGERALYRLYNSGQSGAPNHRYTTDTAIVDQMIANGWVFEGDALTRVFACVPE